MFARVMGVHVVSVKVVVRHHAEASQFFLVNCRHRAVALIAAERVHDRVRRAIRPRWAG